MEWRQHTLSLSLALHVSLVRSLFLLSVSIRGRINPGAHLSRPSARHLNSIAFSAVVPKDHQTRHHTTGSGCVRASESEFSEHLGARGLLASLLGTRSY